MRASQSPSPLSEAGVSSRARETPRQQQRFPISWMPRLMMLPLKQAREPAALARYP